MNPSLKNPRVIDRLLEIPYEGDPGLAAAERVVHAAEMVSRLVPEQWYMQNDQIVAPSIKVLSCIGLVPSLVQIAKAENHDTSIARRVTDNLKGLGAIILSTKELVQPALQHRSFVKGAMSEYAVLTSLWAMTAKGLLHDDCYILPTASYDDSANTQNGLRVGTDLFLSRSSTPDVERWIQVKTSTEGARSKTYIAGTVMLSVADLMEDSSGGKPDELLKICVEDDEDRLASVAERAKISFAQAKARENHLAAHKVI